MHEEFPHETGRSIIQEANSERNQQLQQWSYFNRVFKRKILLNDSSLLKVKWLVENLSLYF